MGIPSSSVDIVTDNVTDTVLWWSIVVGNDTSDATSKISTLFLYFNLYGLMIA